MLDKEKEENSLGRPNNFFRAGERKCTRKPEKSERKAIML